MEIVQMKLFEIKNEESFNHTADTYKGIYALHEYCSRKPHISSKYNNKMILFII
ncbi:MAG: hypothetical protein KatS3mg068_2739 [Candidatus Sericytochromatia bacterium]|nr:MAG: hypothetical protein KatS3mg068_2739 [Candidatus Sericytochromatia bacterium]